MTLKSDTPIPIKARARHIMPRWSKLEEQYLHDIVKNENGVLYIKNPRITQIAKRLGRTKRAIELRLRKLGYYQPSMKRPTNTQYHEALTEISRQTSIPVEIILSKRKLRHLAHARWRVFKILYDQNCSSTGIAAVSGYDHTTIIHGLNKLKKLAKAVGGSINNIIVEKCHDGTR